MKKFDVPIISSPFVAGYARIVDKEPLQVLHELFTCVAVVAEARSTEFIYCGWAKTIVAFEVATA